MEQGLLQCSTKDKRQRLGADNDPKKTPVIQNNGTNEHKVTQVNISFLRLVTYHFVEMKKSEVRGADGSTGEENKQSIGAVR